MNSTGSEQICLPVVGSGEYGNQPSDFITGGKFMDYPSDHKLLIKDFAP
jgi:hypothetical protein